MSKRTSVGTQQERGGIVVEHRVWPRVFQPAAIASLGIVTAVLIGSFGYKATSIAQTPESSSPQTKPDYSPLTDYLSSSIPFQMKQKGVPGLAAVLVDTDRVLWAKGFGFSDPQGENPVTAETMFSIQSCSKAVTATAILVAVQDGLLDLDAPITKYVPSFKINSRFEDHPEEKITLRHLLSHRAGLTHEAALGNGRELGEECTFEDHVRSISDTWLRFPVGQRISYSNLGISLAGYVLQKVSGQDFEDYVAQRLFEPIGMHESSFNPDKIKGHPKRAIGHDPKHEILPVGMAMIPAGGCYTSAYELGRFLQFHLNQGRVAEKQLLGPALLQEMYTIPFPHKDQWEGYALGVHRTRTWYINGSDKGIQTYWLNHSGGGLGFGCAMQWFPEYGLGVVVLSRAPDTTLVHNIAWTMLSGAIQRKIGTIPVFMPYESLEARDYDRKLLERICGTYGAIEPGRMTIELQGDKCGIRSGSGEYELLHFVTLLEAFTDRRGQMRQLYRFVLNDQGTPQYLVKVNDGYLRDFIAEVSPTPGPNKPEWDRYIGKYEWRNWGQLEGTITIRRTNGYLTAEVRRATGRVYWTDARLDEFREGLFFLPDGEALDFRHDPPTYRNIRLHRAG